MNIVLLKIVSIYSVYDIKNTIIYRTKNKDYNFHMAFIYFIYFIERNEKFLFSITLLYQVSLC